MAGLRAVVSVAALGCWLGLGGCVPDAGHDPDGDDVLVLELGGDHPSLRESLRASGVLPAPAPAPPAPRTEPPADPVAAPPAESPRPEPPEFFTVRLGEGETLWDLARQHLGKGPRWTEILTLNGWTEEQARRLRPGTEVRIPRR